MGECVTCACARTHAHDTCARCRFHPGQPSNFLSAAWFIKRLATDHPDFIGDINPNNALIEKLFGDQGGYY
jgi:hypothetical protein